VYFRRSEFPLRCSKGLREHLSREPMDQLKVDALLSAADALAEIK